MLTFKNREPVINTKFGLIHIWDDEKNDYVIHSFEFIEDLAEIIKNAKIESLAK